MLPATLDRKQDHRDHHDDLDQQLSEMIEAPLKTRFWSFVLKSFRDLAELRITTRSDD